MQKISIITVCYNSANTLEGCINSVLKQTYPSIEYIIIDGCSNDNTLEILKKYSNKLKYISEPDKGIYDAMNKGISIATGEVIGILNSDDEYFDNCVLEKVMHEFQKTDYQIVYGNIIMYAYNNLLKPIRLWISGKQKPFSWGWHPPHPAVFIKKEVYTNHGVYNIEKNISADFDLLLRFFEVKKIKAFYLNMAMVKMRLGGASTGTFKNIIKGNKQIKESFKQNGVTYFWIYPFLRFSKKLLQYIKK